jgi:hypothetical protein
MQARPSWQEISDFGRVFFLMAGINYGELSAETFGVSVAIAFFDAI